MTESIDETQGDPPIRGTHVILRDWRNEDLEPFRHWLGPGHAWHRFDGPYYALGTPEQTNASVELRRRLMETGSFPSPRVDLVIADAIDDRLIGRVNRYWISEETDWLALGIALYDERSWGDGDSEPKRSGFGASTCGERCPGSSDSTSALGPATTGCRRSEGGWDSGRKPGSGWRGSSTATTTTASASACYARNGKRGIRTGLGALAAHPTPTSAPDNHVDCGATLRITSNVDEGGA